MNKNLLAFKLIISGLISLGVSIGCYLLLVTPAKELSNKETIPIFISLLSLGATFYAPIAAYLLYDSWKSQTKFNRVTNNIIELQKELHSYIAALKSLRQRIISPYRRSKFKNNEEDYLNNLSKLFDQKICEINTAKQLKYEVSKTLSIIKTDTYSHNKELLLYYNQLIELIDNISCEIDGFTIDYTNFINIYRKDESEVKLAFSSDEYKEITYKISVHREVNNVLKGQIDTLFTNDISSVDPQLTKKIHGFIKQIDETCEELLKDYEKIS